MELTAPQPTHSITALAAGLRTKVQEVVLGTQES